MMNLWYKPCELREAQQEAKRIVDRLNEEIPIYINGDVKVRMAWREDTLAESVKGVDIVGRCYIPAAEILVNGTISRRDHLDLITLDIYALEMKAIRNSRKAERENGGLQQIQDGNP